MKGQSNKSRQSEELPIFVKWLEFLKWLLPILEKFPKKSRFTITNRIENTALNVVELLIEAKYSRDKRPMLKKVNLCFEKMRILLRVSHEMKLIPTKSYHFASKSINETGMMLGGWIRQQSAR